MRVLVCGDRNWTDKAMIKDKLQEVASRGPSLTVIEGEARGADRLAREAAEELAKIFNIMRTPVSVLPYPADWTRFGKGAGPIRNRQMLAEGKPDEVWAFHDDIKNSRGTKDMVAQATRAGIPVRLFSHIVHAVHCAVNREWQSLEDDCDCRNP